ncbi:MAG: hypothetical protein K0U93_02455 [Gammaproteobacteria bacterium]|nr:hypothetical protein [Gammaproteobacteria bacterium]
MTRILGSLMLWTLGAAITAGIILLLYLAWQLNQQGQSINGLSPDQLLSEFTRYGHLIIYAAIAGFILGLIALIPPIVRENAERVIFWGVFGAISGAITALCAMFLYKGYQLMSQGVAADAVPFVQLVAGEMKLHAYVPYGAILGAIIAALLAILALRPVNPQSRGGSADRYRDPDEMIRARRAQRARRYLAERGAKEPDMM